MISVVNGYVCHSSCEAEKAKQGKDPNAPPGAPPGTTAKSDKTSGFDKQPVTVLDGALKDFMNGNAVTAAGIVAPTGAAQPAAVNLLV